MRLNPCLSPDPCFLDHLGQRLRSAFGVVDVTQLMHEEVIEFDVFAEQAHGRPHYLMFREWSPV
jgi:hypothetical protein